MVGTLGTSAPDDEEDTLDHTSESRNGLVSVRVAVIDKDLKSFQTAARNQLEATTPYSDHHSMASYLS